MAWVWIGTANSISVGWCKKDVTPLLTHWSYVFLALTHGYERCRHSFDIFLHVQGCQTSEKSIIFAQHSWLFSFKTSIGIYGCFTLNLWCTCYDMHKINGYHAMLLFEIKIHICKYLIGTRNVYSMNHPYEFHFDTLCHGCLDVMDQFQPIRNGQCFHGTVFNKANLRDLKAATGL